MAPDTTGGIYHRRPNLSMTKTLEHTIKATEDVTLATFTPNQVALTLNGADTLNSWSFARFSLSPAHWHACGVNIQLVESPVRVVPGAV
jgi:hypothetical protein